jgi:hypothetical protein
LPLPKDILVSMPSSTPLETEREKLLGLQDKVLRQPYSAIARLNLAEGYCQYGYPDLAAWEAYLVLLLCDETTQPIGEFTEFAVEAAKMDWAQAIGAYEVTYDEFETKVKPWADQLLHKEA